MKPSSSCTPASRQASTISTASAASTANGLSTSTCFPARAAAITQRWCSDVGSGMYTASISGSASSSSYDPYAVGIPNSAANSRARSSERLATARSTPFRAFRIPGPTDRRAIRAADKIPQRMGPELTTAPGSLGGGGGCGV